jgi:23S rRNA (cytidine1920-2'-O)/16S rRNA (cytidine1409-2'-O)-methyltransferase
MYLCEVMEERLDKLLVQLNLVDSRVNAEKLILEVGVNVNGKLIYKPGKKFKSDSNIKLVALNDDWLSVHAFKILGAIEKWKIKLENKICLDAFCGLGSISQVLLSKNIEKVYLHDTDLKEIDKVLENGKVLNRTGFTLRELTEKEIPEKIDFCFVNSSNQSLSKTLPFIQSFLDNESLVVCVIRPKLEVEKEHLKNNGEVRNTLAYPSMFDSLTKTAKLNNLEFVDSMKSPILGDDGKEEFIILLKKS